MNQVVIQLKTANQRPAGRGFMVICDAVVDGNDADVIFWDPPQAGSLTPGTTLQVVQDGVNAKWNTHNGRTSFQIRPAAAIEITQQGAAQETPPNQGGGAAPQAAPPVTKKSATEILQRATELVKEYQQLLVNAGIAPEVAAVGAVYAPSIVSSWWFGAEGKWA